MPESEATVSASLRWAVTPSIRTSPEKAAWSHQSRRGRAVEVSDEELIHAGAGGQPHHRRKIRGVVSGQEVADQNPQRDTPLTRATGEVPGGCEHRLELRSVAQGGVVVGVAGHRDHDSVHVSLQQPARGFLEQVAVGRQADRATGRSGISRPGRKEGMEQRLTPALELNVLGQLEIRCHDLPQGVIQIALAPRLSQ